ncbi:MAG: hypothetical protein A4S09_15900 [Proteobacteria bacterium SG_bin7]|nr:MAG: hypothetical protein A4S09_15900 [Proteobacteria bacterium SG_bin7]
MRRNMGKSVFYFVVLAVIVSVFYSNCSPTHNSGNGSSNINTAAILQSLQTNSLKILTDKCSSCHNDATVNSTLKDILDVNYLESSGFIDPGSPQTSPLYMSIVDQIMPKNGTPLSAEDIAILRDWIAALGGNFNTFIGAVDGGNTGGGSGNNVQGTFTQVNQILQQRCVNCHGGQQKPNLNLVYAQLIVETTAANLRVITPGDVSNSRLYQSVVTNSMPQGNALTNTQKEIIRTWIAAGARND